MVGGDANITGTFFVKELKTRLNETGGLNISSANITSSAFKPVQWIILNNTKSSANIIAKATISTESNNSNAEANYRFVINGVAGTISRRAFSDESLPGVTKMSEVLQGVNAGLVNVTLEANCDNSDCTILGCDLFTYVTTSEVFTRNSFNVTIHDLNNESQLSDWNITLENGTVLSTTGNSLEVPFGDNQLENITIQKDGYFPKTVLDHDTDFDLNSSIWQSQLFLEAFDSFTGQQILIFSISSDNFTNAFTSGVNTTNGSVLVRLQEKDKYNVTLTTFAESKYNDQINTTAEVNITVNFSLLGSGLQLKLFRESTGNKFNISAVNSSYASVICTNNNMYNQTITATEQVLATPCVWKQILIYVDYLGGNSYFRSIIPPITPSLNVTFVFLIDLLAGDIAVQNIIQLNDLTGDFSDATLSLDTVVNNSVFEVIKTTFNADRSTTVYLVKNRNYIMRITSNDGEVFELGVIVADEAQTLVITVPDIDILPDVPIPNQPPFPGSVTGSNTSQGGVYWDYEFDVSMNLLQLIYVDPFNRTLSVSFDIHNRTNSSVNKTSLIPGLLPLTCTNSSACTFVINAPAGIIKENMTYYTTLIINHSDLGVWTEEKVFASVFFNEIDLGFV